MTDSYGPFDGSPFAEAQWYDYAPLWASPGVVGTPAASATTGPLAFTASGLSVSAGVGKAWIRGAGFSRTGTPPTHAVEANANATLSRRDRLVLRRNLATHLVETAVIQGTPSGTPVAPALTQVDAGIWEEPLFSFLVPPNNGTTLTGVIDERGWVSAGGSVAYASRSLCIVQRNTQSIPASGAWTRVTGWTTEQASAAFSVNTGTGIITCARDGVLSISGYAFSDDTVPGRSGIRVRVPGGASAFPLEHLYDNRYRGGSTAFGSAGNMRQPWSWSGRIQAGETTYVDAQQENSDDGSIPYNVYFALEYLTEY